ncbi:MAG: chromosomal replication initiator protein DnaA [Desulfobacterales bacterium]|nr:chromosomal replication initiator protein DnaA [Desulfobacterales bacterium]MDJ0875123.1 chromosomal replication initiator protein DnaA [Desulfobacterales bacterium]MDJ0883976.1 chromosomal replication initiator protein DnaA [Desulfobacterales bacterium]
MEQYWKKIKSTLKNTIPLHSFRMWIEPLAVGRGDGGELFIECPNAFSLRRVQDQYSQLIRTEFERLMGQTCQFRVANGRQASPGGRDALAVDPQMVLPEINRHVPTGRFLRRDFTFDQFVVGRNNDFAYSASLSLASTRQAPQNCLYLLSNTGLGKSHLTQAIGHHILDAFPQERVYYTTAEDFSNEMVAAFRNDSLAQFKGKYRNQCDVLLLEDVHLLGGKERTQLELSATLDTLFESGKKIIFSSCYCPSDIPRLTDKLRSRFAYGLISNIEPPNFGTRVRILEKKAGRQALQVPKDVVHYLASELADDIRQLESGLLQVAAKSSLLGCAVDLKLAESVIRNIVRKRKTITINVIKKIVCRHYGIAPKDLVSRSRKQSIVRPRQVAIFLSRRYTDAPLQTIGKSFNRYHATALHSINTIEKGMQDNAALRKQVTYIAKKLETGDF